MIINDDIDETIEVMLTENRTLVGHAKQQNVERISSCLDRAEALKMQLQASSAA